MRDDNILDDRTVGRYNLPWVVEVVRGQKTLKDWNARIIKDRKWQNIEIDNCWTLSNVDNDTTAAEKLTTTIQKTETMQRHLKVVKKSRLIPSNVHFWTDNRIHEKTLVLCCLKWKLTCFYCYC